MNEEMGTRREHVCVYIYNVHLCIKYWSEDHIEA